MKTPIRVFALAVAGIAAITATVIAAAPPGTKQEPSVLTLKSKGKPVATLTLNVLDAALLEIAAEGGSRIFGNEGHHTKATFFGGVTVRLPQAGERSAFEISAEEIDMQWSEPQPQVIAAAPQAPKRGPSMLTLKSKGKSVATLTLELLDDAPLRITSEGSSVIVSPTEASSGKASLSGGVTVRSQRADESALFVIKAEEMEMEMDKLKVR